MGLTTSKLWNRVGRRKRYAFVVILGLEEKAGKAAILRRLKVWVIRSAPPPGYMVEWVKFKNMTFTIADVGNFDNDRLRPLWRHFLRDTDGLIFVVDSNDVREDRIELAAMTLHRALNDLPNVVILVFANDQDLPNAMDASVLSHNLKLHNIPGNQWHIQPCSASTGVGLYEGLEWLSEVLSKSNK